MELDFSTHTGKFATSWAQLAEEHLAGAVKAEGWAAQVGPSPLADQFLKAATGDRNQAKRYAALEAGEGVIHCEMCGQLFLRSEAPEADAHEDEHYTLAGLVR